MLGAAKHSDPKREKHHPISESILPEDGHNRRAIFGILRATRKKELSSLRGRQDLSRSPCRDSGSEAGRYAQRAGESEH